MNIDPKPTSTSQTTKPISSTFSEMERQLAGIPDIGAELVKAYQAAPDMMHKFKLGFANPEPFLRTFFFREDDNYEKASNIAESENFHLADFSRFKDQIVLDVGAGKLAIGYLAAVAAGAKAYIAIEHVHDKACLEAINLVRESNPKIPFAVINPNASDFIPLIPNDSVSFLISGIDAFLYYADINGLKELAAPMPQKLHPKGVIISISSDLDFPELDQRKFIISITDVKIATKRISS